LADCLLWAVFYNCRSSPNFLPTFFHGKRYALILTNMGWATFRAIFSQTHMVTLSISRANMQKNFWTHLFSSNNFKWTPYELVWCTEQGDQIGRIFAFWAILYILWSFLKISEVAQIFAILFPR
jgi:hypothetical protein